MSKFYQKTRIFSCFFAAAALMICSCLEQLDYEEFIENEEVKEYIEKINVSVELTDDSDDGLTGGVGKVSGLTEGRYYKVEKKNDDSTFTFLGFLKDDGTLSNSINDISRAATGAEITGLINGETYRVVSAKPVANNTDINVTNHVPQTVKVDATGTINLSPPEPGIIYSMPPLGITAGNAREIAKVKISSGGAASSVSLTGGLIQLEGHGTTTDYIFIEKNNGNSIIKFDVLKVNIQVYTAPPEANIINVTFNITDRTLTFSQSSVSIAQDTLAGGGGANIT
ncbi:MAG: hypothetical protein FWC21_03320, partial [Treponema sp.]|nr:hypothetical protein [Treponema sp.]